MAVKILKETTEEKRATLLGQGRGVFSRKSEAARYRIELQITRCRHPAEPFPGIALVNTGAYREFGASQRSMCR